MSPRPLQETRPIEELSFELALKEVGVGIAGGKAVTGGDAVAEADQHGLTGGAGLCLKERAAQQQHPD